MQEHIVSQEKAALKVTLRAQQQQGVHSLFCHTPASMNPHLLNLPLAHSPALTAPARTHSPAATQGFCPPLPSAVLEGPEPQAVSAGLATMQAPPPVGLPAVRGRLLPWRAHPPGPLLAAASFHVHAFPQAVLGATPPACLPGRRTPLAAVPPLRSPAAAVSPR